MSQYQIFRIKENDTYSETDNRQQTRAKPSLWIVNEPDHLICFYSIFFLQIYFNFNFFPPNLFQFHKSSIFLKNLFGFCFSSTHKSVYSIIYRRIKWWRRESCVLMRCLFKKKTRHAWCWHCIMCCLKSTNNFYYERIAHVFPSWSKTMIVQSPGYTSIRCRR